MLELPKAFKCVCVYCVFCVLIIESLDCASKQPNKANVIDIASTIECYPSNRLLTVLRVDGLYLPGALYCTLAYSAAVRYLFFNILSRNIV